MAQVRRFVLSLLALILVLTLFGGGIIYLYLELVLFGGSQWTQCGLNWDQLLSYSFAANF